MQLRAALISDKTRIIEKRSVRNGISHLRRLHRVGLKNKAAVDERKKILNQIF